MISIYSLAAVLLPSQSVTAQLAYPDCPSSWSWSFNSLGQTLAPSRHICRPYVMMEVYIILDFSFIPELMVGKISVYDPSLTPLRCG
ncbi:hypothetical protein BJV78DRAFT_1244932 [Lactifluus subvellereus]|nr:hypothetical protein BJV78DRAFT_1244932 [Lactifluus subvellereus]